MVEKRDEGRNEGRRAKVDDSNKRRTAITCEETTERFDRTCLTVVMEYRSSRHEGAIGERRAIVW